LTVAANANVVFFPWVRQGAATVIPVVDTLGSNQRAVVDLQAGLAIDSISPVETVPTPVRLRGPADVVGIDPHEIVRMDPRPGTADFEPNYFAAIEFDRPDFPWLFTPARADASGRVRPWLCLVVVRAQAGVTLQSTADVALPVLEIGAPANPGEELPDLAESHLWVHAQAASSAGASAAELRATLAGDPGLSLSRLLCPRLLAPNTDYIACVVPTFEVGRKAGLGMTVTEAELTGSAGLQQAWSLTPSPATVRLPVYHQWRFRTGEGGDFESLLRLLQPRTAPSGLGTRPIDIRQPGFQLPSTLPNGTPIVYPETIEITGALRPLDTFPPTWPVEAAAAFQQALAAIVNAPGITEVSNPAADPLLAPPLYGRWHAARSTATPGATPWFDELNLDPRYRCIAALGTRVIQEHQETLMAAAWEQAADLQPANQRLRQLQLGFVVSTRLHTRHFQALSDDAALRIVAPAFGRLHGGSAASLVATTETLVKRIGNSAVPVRAASPAMRRIGRERGPITRRVMTQGLTRSAASTWVVALNTAGSVFVAPPWFDLASVKIIRDHLPLPASVRPYRDVTASLVHGMVGRPGFQIVAEGQPVPVPPLAQLPSTSDSPAAAVFRAAARTHLTRIDPARTAIVFTPPQPLAIAATRAAIQAEIEPTRTFVALARAVVTTGANATKPAADAPGAAVPIDTVMAAPTFRQAMYEPLRDLSQELLLPGADAVLPNSVLGLKTNRRFIEAYMAGLNVEMARELLWRGFPTDQRGTCFDQFWDNRGSAAPRPDIRPLHEWGNRPLGEAYATGERDRFVMLLRSDLLRRYPNAIVYAVKAIVGNGPRRPSTNEVDEVYPTFAGSMAPDISFVGFDLSSDDVVGSRAYGSARIAGPGYYIVIQEQPTEPRFGLEVGTPVGSGTHLRVSAGAPAGLPLNGLEWGRNAAQMAGIVRQQPVRIAIHASQLVASPSSPAIGGSLLTDDSIGPLCGSE
jgi:hypothetical protein